MNTELYYYEIVGHYYFIIQPDASLFKNHFHLMTIHLSEIENNLNLIEIDSLFMQNNFKIIQINLTQIKTVIT